MIELEHARSLWLDGQRRLREVAPESRRAVDGVVDVLVAELRRRLGSRFSAQELADLYDGSQRWTMGLAVRSAPDEPIAWEQWVADAAFGQYLRNSADWPGGVSSGGA